MNLLSKLLTLVVMSFLGLAGGVVMGMKTSSPSRISGELVVVFAALLFANFVLLVLVAILFDRRT